MNTHIRIGRHVIGPNQEPFIIAEMSGNHNQSLQRALAIVDAAAAAGAHALKLQTYTADTMTLDIDHGDFVIQDESSLWHGETLYSLYQKAHTPWEWHEAIFQRCREQGLACISSPFDASAVDFLLERQVDALKIASFENTDLALIEKAAATGLPLIISTGLASVAELDRAVRAARRAGCRQLILLKCTSTYPASPEDSNLLTIPHMRDLFHCPVGLSDHTGGLGAAVASVALGACVIEKHFTLSRADGGVDAAFSLEPAELAQLVEETARAQQALGQVHYGGTTREQASLKFRRSLYIVEDLPAGAVLTATNLRAIRPGYGLSPEYYQTVLGMAVQGEVKKGTPLSWDLLQPGLADAGEPDLER